MEDMLCHVDAMSVYVDTETITKLCIFETKEKDINKIKTMIEEEFKVIKCTHEHDCCGCVHKVEVENITIFRHDIVSAYITWHFNI
jgi:hypothetical protein